jgi:hypothetical protein
MFVALDREALIRAVRRRQVTEALDAERSRTEALGERLEELVTELDGASFDARILGEMDPVEAELVRVAVVSDDAALYDGDDPERDPAAELKAYRESEVARVAQELESSRARQRAFESYLELLG